MTEREKGPCCSRGPLSERRAKRRPIRGEGRHLSHCVTHTSYVESPAAATGRFILDAVPPRRLQSVICSAVETTRHSACSTSAILPHFKTCTTPQQLLLQSSPCAPRWAAAAWATGALLPAGWWRGQRRRRSNSSSLWRPPEVQREAIIQWQWQHSSRDPEST